MKVKKAKKIKLIKTKIYKKMIRLIECLNQLFLEAILKNREASPINIWEVTYHFQMLAII